MDLCYRALPEHWKREGTQVWVILFSDFREAKYSHARHVKFVMLVNWTRENLRLEELQFHSH